MVDRELGGLVDTVSVCLDAVVMLVLLCHHGVLVVVVSVCLVDSVFSMLSSSPVVSSRVPVLSPLFPLSHVSSSRLSCLCRGRLLCASWRCCVVWWSHCGDWSRVDAVYVAWGVDGDHG